MSNTSDGHSTYIKGIAIFAVSFLLCVLMTAGVTPAPAGSRTATVATAAVLDEPIPIRSPHYKPPAPPPASPLPPALVLPPPAPPRPKPPAPAPHPYVPRYAPRLQPAPNRYAARPPLPRQYTTHAAPYVAPNQIQQGSIRDYARSLTTDVSQFTCLAHIIDRESGWNAYARNPSGAYGLPQALPGAKMASAGADWRTNPRTQLRWMISYITGRYGSPCSAWSFWQGHSWY